MGIKYEVNNFELLDKAMVVAEKVFQPTTEEKKKYHDRGMWNERAKLGMLVVGLDEDKVVGFAICYPKDGRFHIWNVGVLEEYRGNGVWQSIYDLIVKFAKGKGYSSLTLNTFPDDFTNMYRFTIKRGFVEINSEIDPLSKKRKVFLEKKI